VWSQFRSAPSWHLRSFARRLRIADYSSNPGGSADQAGLHAGTERAYLGNTAIMLGGDLTWLSTIKVQDEEDLMQMMNNHRAGDTVKITIYRTRKK